MNRKPTAIAAIAVLGIGGLLLAGCAPVNPAKSTPAAQLPTVGWKSIAASDVKDGGTLNLAVAQSGTDGGNWNPETAEGNETDVAAILAPLQGSVYKASDSGDYQLDPNYAESVTLLSKSPQTVDVKLNPAAVWQDGSPITSADYKATWATLSGTKKGFDVVSSAGYDDIKTFDAVSDTEFKFTFKSPYADWKNLLVGSPLQAAIASNEAAWNKGYVTAPLPSDGPYIMTKIDNSADTFTETPNPKWWGTKPKLAAITFTVIDQTAQAQAFVNGEINEVDAADVDTYDAAMKKAGAVKESSGGLSWSQVTFNGNSGFLADVKLRKAVAQAINRTIMAKAANTPLGVEATTDGNWIFMPGQAGYKDTVNATLPYSPSAAKKALQDDGWTLKNKSWTKKGKTLKLSIIFPQGSASNELRAQQIQSSLKAIDVPVAIQQVPSANYFNDIIAGKFEMTTFGWSGTLAPISAAQSLFNPAQKPGNENGQNYAFITSPKLKALWASANTDLNPASRLKTADKINNVIASYMPMLPIYPYPNVDIVDSDVANYGPATFASVDWTKVGFKK
jgi:peptide/nickel transport system substrate-binding protein